MTILFFTYVLPMILTIIVLYHKSDEVTNGDFIMIVFVSLFPILNFFIGYVGGLIVLCESKTINNFLNKRIK
jgi:hypothetical protein